MADILIKNMKMPKEKDDVVILTIQPDGTANVFGRRLLSLLRPSAEIHGLRKGIKTAIELPSHGRLIDADGCGKVLLDKYTEGLDKWDELYRAGYRYALKYFSQAPTIVEASNGSDN